MGKLIRKGHKFAWVAAYERRYTEGLDTRAFWADLGFTKRSGWGRLVAHGFQHEHAVSSFIAKGVLPYSLFLALRDWFGRDEKGRLRAPVGWVEPTIVFREASARAGKPAPLTASVAQYREMVKLPIMKPLFAPLVNGAAGKALVVHADAEAAPVKRKYTKRHSLDALAGDDPKQARLMSETEVHQLVHQRHRAISGLRGNGGNGNGNGNGHAMPPQGFVDIPVSFIMRMQMIPVVMGGTGAQG